MVAREIVDFLGFVMDIVFNNFVVWYLILPGIFTIGFIKVCKEDDKPYLRPLLKFLAIYYVARTIVIIFFW